MRDLFCDVIAICEAPIRVKSASLIKSRLKPEKKRKCGNKRHFT